MGISEGKVKEIWNDILKLHYKLLPMEDFERKYSNKFVMGKLALTSPFVLQRFRRTNKDKRLKPFNFVIVGIGHKLDPTTKEQIIPILAYTKNTDIVPFSPFTDYKTGKEYKDNTQFYWKPFSEFLFGYMDHKDNKYDGDTGELRRKHIDIGDIEHIGKESNNLEETEVIGVSDNDYVIYNNKTEKKIADVIKRLTPKRAKQIGLSKRNLRYLRKKIKEGKTIKQLKRKTLNKLIQYMN
ncbi:MAG: hypothetical protein ACP5UH_02870 [Candidatus Micrarchaeia archaeon]